MNPTMHTNFKRLLGDATRLTRQGDLASATRAIREALGADGPDPTSSEPRTVPDGAPSRESDATVIDGEWRRIDTGTDIGPDAEPKADPDADPDADLDADLDAGPDAGDDAGRGDGHVGTDTRSADAGSSGTAARNGREPDPANADGTVVRACHSGKSGALDYRLFVPALLPDAPAPALVVMLHGCTQDAEDFARGTGMDALGREHGFLVLYPEQASRANAQRCWNWFEDVHQRRGRGEPGMIEEMTRTIVAEHGVDPARVFVAGLSAGGAMAAILGNTYPELFAAVGVHSGLAAGSAQDLPGALAAMRGGQGPLADPGLDVPVRRSAPGPARRQPPTIVFHGDADRVVHPDNGERVVAVCLDGLPMASDAGRAPERRDGQAGGRDWTHEVHRDANEAIVVERWRVHGAGHAWSGGQPRGSYTDAKGPDASAEMVRFFLRTDR